MEKEAIRRAVMWAYAEIGEKGSHPPAGMVFPTGAWLALSLGYPEDVLMGMSARSLEGFVGAAPLPRHIIETGERGLVVDCGAGSGLDALWLATRGFPVVALDLSGPMMARLKKGLAFMRPELNAPVDLVRAGLPEIPVADEKASFVSLNGVANLVPERLDLLREVHRVLKPGGVFLAADVLALAELDDTLRNDADAWAYCVGGAECPGKWLEDLAACGFVNATCEVLEEFFPLGRGLIKARKARVGQKA